MPLISFSKTNILEKFCESVDRGDAKNSKKFLEKYQNLKKEKKRTLYFELNKRDLCYLKRILAFAKILEFDNLFVPIQKKLLSRENIFWANFFKNLEEN